MTHAGQGDKQDKVAHPSHYNQGTIEVLDFINDHHLCFLLGNVVKYVSRYRFKNGVEDLKKADFYLTEYIHIERYKEKSSLVKFWGMAVGRKYKYTAHEFCIDQKLLDECIEIFNIICYASDRPRFVHAQHILQRMIEKMVTEVQPIK